MKIGYVDVVEAHGMEHGRVHIVHVRSPVDAAEPDLVRCADDLAALDATAGHEYRESPRVVIAAFAFLVERCPAEFSAPDDKDIIEHSTRLQIRKQPGDRLV